jgi:hypothetical protein
MVRQKIGLVNVATLAQDKHLPVAFLEELGLTDLPGGGVRIPYRDKGGAELFSRKRGLPGGPPYLQPSGTSLAPYGLWRLGADPKHVFIAEGESDAWTLWHAGITALGIPGAGAYACLKAEHLEGITDLFLCPDADQAGEDMVKGVLGQLAALDYRGTVYRVPLPPGVKDVSDLHVSDPPGFQSRWQAQVTGSRVLYIPRHGSNGHTGNGKAHPPLVEKDPPPEEADATPKITAADVATLADLAKAGAEIRWLWPGWIQIGVLTALASEAGLGKTRFCADLLRRLRQGLPWPDGEKIALPDASSATALWVVSDQNHDELVSLARDFGIEDAIYVNALKTDPYSGVSLETAEDLGALGARIAAVKPRFVVVDTVGGATDKNLGRQEDARAFYAPLQVMARENACAFLCLTHLSATGQFLGRRVLEKVRTAIKMGRPDANDKRRCLELVKTNSRKPPALGVSMGDTGNEYDDNPPIAPEGEEAPQRSASAVDRCAQWLTGQLDGGAMKVHVLRTAAEAEGFSSKTIYGAKAHLGLEEFTADDRKFWRLPEVRSAFD